MRSGPRLSDRDNRHRASGRHAEAPKCDVSADAKSESSIHVDGSRIVPNHMNEGPFPACHDSRSHVAHKHRGEPSTAAFGHRTYRADLGPARRMKPFAGHCDEIASFADPPMSAHLDRIR